MKRSCVPGLYQTIQFLVLAFSPPAKSQELGTVNSPQAIIFGKVQGWRQDRLLKDAGARCQACVHVGFLSGRHKTQSSACFDICQAQVAHYSLTLPARHPGEMDIAGLLTATIDTLPAPEWHKIVAVRELASQVDIDLADTDKQSSRIVFAAEADDECGVSKKPEEHGEEFTSMPETALPNSLLWECLHTQCSRNTMFTLLHCRAEQPLWQDSSLQPTCAAGDWQQQRAVHAQASTEQPQRYRALLWVLAAAWTLSVIMAWRCGAQTAHPSVDSRAVARTRNLELLSTFKEIPDVPALDMRVHSSGESAGTVALPAGSKTSQHWMSPRRMAGHMQAQSRQDSDVNVTEFLSDEEASAEVGSHQGGQQRGVHRCSTAKREGSMCTRRQSSLWERTGRRLQRADSNSISGAQLD